LVDLTLFSSQGSHIHCKIITRRVLNPPKPVNFPPIKTTLPALTHPDLIHIPFPIHNNIHIIPPSFLPKPDHIPQIRTILKHRAPHHLHIIPKI
ncbi:pyruvate kinase, partial [Paenibacillus xylanexedens]|uniref:pyruvate kinase n=1 Tax=Paenibacillus xylanexedens TaxID=528191 RepID=UPI0021B3FC63